MSKLNKNFVTGQVLEASDLNDIVTAHNDINIGSGTGTNSIVQLGGNNQAISEGAIVLGTNNVAGVKGWYYEAIDFTNKQIYLSHSGSRADIGCWYL